MAEYNFAKIPQRVPLVKTKHRVIRTKIPAPGSIGIFKDLERYESRSMHGQLPVVWDKAENFRVFDRYGNCWIDFTSTIFLANAGHSNPAIINAIKKQLNQKLIHTYTFAHQIRAKFLKKLIEIVPSYLEKAFLLSAGTEATECALKLMRMHGQGINPKKLAVIAFRGNMHGRTLGAEMLKGDPTTSAWIGYKDPNIYQLPFPYPWSINDSYATHDWAKHFIENMEALKAKGLVFDNICGFMIESYQGWGAVFLPQVYVKTLSRFAKKYKALIAFDDIQGGFGRTGKLFAYQHYNIQPDIVCIGKALSGSLPLSAVLGSAKTMDLPDAGSMSSTHSANPMSCAAALANIGQIKRKNLIKEAARKGKILHAYLDKLKDKYPQYISYVLGKGLLAAIIITHPKSHKAACVLASRICEKAMQKGLLLMHTGRESIKIGPPLTISDEALKEGLGVLEESISELTKYE